MWIVALLAACLPENDLAPVRAPPDAPPGEAPTAGDHRAGPAPVAPSGGGDADGPPAEVLAPDLDGTGGFGGGPGDTAVPDDDEEDPGDDDEEEPEEEPAEDTGADGDPGDVEDPAEDPPEDPVDTGGSGLPEPPVEEPAPEGDADFLFGNVLHDLHIGLSDTNWAALDRDPETDVPASLTFEGYTWQVGLHLKGTTSFRSLYEKAAFKIDVREFDPFAPQFYGLRRLTLNNMVQDETMLREHAAYRLYADRGVPAPRHGYARVFVNGELFGVYGFVESMDQDFVDRFWPDDDEGNFYETRNGAGDVEAGRERGFDLQEEGLTPAYDDLEALIDAVEAAPPAGILATLDALFDRDEAMRMWAVDLAAGHSDGYPFASNNFLLYHAPMAGLWSFVPWGQDQMFRKAMDVNDVANMDGRLVLDCMAAADCRVALDAYVLDTTWAMEDPAYRAYLEEAAALIADACHEDPRREDPCEQQDLLDWVDERPGIVRAQLGSTAP